MLERDQDQDGIEKTRMGRGWKTRMEKHTAYMCADGLRVEVANKAFKLVQFADRFGNRK